MTIRVALVGAFGRMGRRLDALAAAEADLEVAARIDRDTPPLSEVAAGAADVAIDFSVRAQVAATAAWAARTGTPLVLGTTGLEPEDHAALREASLRTPVLAAPNFSVGVNALFALATEMARLLGAGYDLEVVEAHHRQKVDAPSGTARRLVELLALARGSSYEETARMREPGLGGPRTDREIGVAVVRGGDVVGEHTVFALGPGEQVLLGHRATDRDVFARGALRAARWLARGRAPGLYGMEDVLRRA